jgi:hypothetical protein
VRPAEDVCAVRDGAAATSLQQRRDLAAVVDACREERLRCQMTLVPLCEQFGGRVDVLFRERDDLHCGPTLAEERAVARLTRGGRTCPCGHRSVERAGLDVVSSKARIASYGIER